MPTQVLEFGEWLPDLPPVGNPGATVAKNVLPKSVGYRPIQSFVADTTALDAYCRGHITTSDRDGNKFSYAGDAAKLYVIDSLTWKDVSKAGGYTSDGFSRWVFQRYGETLFASNFLDNLQSLTLGAVSTLFADATGSPPKCRHMAVVRDFLVLGNIDQSGTNVPERVHWSAIGDPTSWAVSSVTQADIQDFPDGGAVQGIAGGEFGIIFQENAITRMTYVGSPVIFQMDKLLPDIGLLAPGSMAQHGNFIFFLAEDGFRVIENGAQITRIGVNKVDRTFFRELDNDNLHRISVTVDPDDSYVIWSVPVTGNDGGTPNKLYIYDFANMRWSFAETELELITQAAVSSVSLDSLDALSVSGAPELVSNGSFASDTVWTKGTDWTIGSGIATKAASSATALEQSISVTTDLAYFISFDVLNYAAGDLTVSLGGTTGQTVSADGTYTETIVCGSSDTKIAFTSDSAFDGAIDNVTVKYASLDAITESLDSKSFSGGGFLNAGFDKNHKRGYFSGAVLAATLETSEFSLSPGRRSMLRSARPMIDGAVCTVRVGARARQADTFSYDAGTFTQQASGRVAIRRDGRWHRLQVSTTGDFEHALGIEVTGSPTGNR